MTFLVLAHDGVDSEAPARRAAARPAHLATALRLRAAGHFLEGGAILDDGGRMIGSMLVMEFPSRAELEAWLAADPYSTGRVWKDVAVRPFKRLQFD
jgi:uncharacterized protein